MPKYRLAQRPGILLGSAIEGELMLVEKHGFTLLFWKGVGYQCNELSKGLRQLAKTMEPLFWMSYPSRTAPPWCEVGATFLCPLAPGTYEIRPYDVGMDEQRAFGPPRGPGSSLWWVDGETTGSKATAGTR